MPGSPSRFGALLAEATRDADIAHGLALAYGDFDSEQRRSLIDAVVEDAQREKLPVFGLLSTLLSAERCPELAAYIVDALKQHCSGWPTKLAGPDQAYLWGDEGQGAAVLAFALHDKFAEAYTLQWHPGERLRAGCRSFVGEGDLAKHVQSLALSYGSAAQRVAMPLAIDHVCKVVLKYRKVAKDARRPLRNLASRLPL